MVHMKVLEFYITNVCNLTCDKCRSFNNFNFKGHYEFDREKMLQWSKLVKIDTIEILGGEPTLHPRLWEWVAGLRELWPDSNLQITTNGTHFKKMKDFHKQLIRYNCNLQVSVHGNHFRKQLAKDVFETFGEITFTEFGLFGDSELTGSIWFKTDSGIDIEIQNGNNLQDICFIDNDFNLHNSDAKLAHENCGISRCHHMIDNKIYKCSIVGLLPEFLRQQGKNTNKFSPYTPLEADTITQESFDNLKHAIPQCSICPEGNSYGQTTSNLKKTLNSYSRRI
jgi:organic radical activating enzyme